MPTTHYKMISTKARWLGIDFLDTLVIIIAFAIINLITSTLIFDFVFCLCLYIGLRVFKATKPDRWFCSEEDAQAAGFRKAYNCRSPAKGK